MEVSMDYADLVKNKETGKYEIKLNDDVIHKFKSKFYASFLLMTSDKLRQLGVKALVDRETNGIISGFRKISNLSKKELEMYKKALEVTTPVQVELDFSVNDKLKKLSKIFNKVFGFTKSTLKRALEMRYATDDDTSKLGSLCKQFAGICAVYNECDSLDEINEYLNEYGLQLTATSSMVDSAEDFTIDTEKQEMVRDFFNEDALPESNKELFDKMIEIGDELIEKKEELLLSMSTVGRTIERTIGVQNSTFKKSVKKTALKKQKHTLDDSDFLTENKNIVESENVISIFEDSVSDSINRQSQLDKI